jgi:hypothetical protein
LTREPALSHHRSVSKVDLRITVALVFAALVVGLIVGSRAQASVQSGPLPAVQATIYVDLSAGRVLSDGPAEYEYAHSLASEFEARLLGAYHWPRDIRVTAMPPSCFESRRGCPGEIDHWAFQIRSAMPIDQTAARIALGPGEITLRGIVGAGSTGCGHRSLAYYSAPLEEPFIPESAPGSACVSLGPMLRRTTQMQAYDAGNDVGPFPSGVAFVPQLEDSDWLLAYCQAHPNQDIALLFDGWVVASIHPQDVVDRARNAPTQPYPPMTVPMTTTMAAAIETPLMTLQPVVQ